MIAKTMSHEEMVTAGEAWYQKQLAILEKAHGPSWPAHREWLEDYLKEELRLRFIANGWRPKS
ncbi:hypothetical protein ASE11_19085 [Hydrogenophaga sp. Root209]|uniref:hypothetical protein n=1 Tax=Hydrogenophaga sp. Root209 TaxID=1736490 RepID=UPI0006F5647B|nr:hypothetical protein [Hydrogenophaga sp. Root209]KRC11514.1 hypothetical protein ASE11_19085 [Hydrogenophaga sp. Root209]